MVFINYEWIVVRLVISYAIIRFHALIDSILIHKDLEKIESFLNDIDEKINIEYNDEIIYS